MKENYALSNCSKSNTHFFICKFSARFHIYITFPYVLSPYFVLFMTLFAGVRNKTPRKKPPVRGQGQGQGQVRDRVKFRVWGLFSEGGIFFLEHYFCATYYLPMKSVNLLCASLCVTCFVYLPVFVSCKFQFYREI